MNAVSGISRLLTIAGMSFVTCCLSGFSSLGCAIDEGKPCEDLGDCRGSSCLPGYELMCTNGICDCTSGSGGTGGSGGSAGTGGSGGTDGTCGAGCGSPSDFSGTWTGTYECTFRDAECGEPFGGDITLMVMQNGCAATYSDEEATYAGSVCGNVFEFEGGGPGYTESGALTLVTPNEATKESTFVNTGDSCTADCADVLSRQP